MWETHFISVAATVRRDWANASNARTWFGERNGTTLTSVTHVDILSCLISCFFLSSSPVPKRSLTVSLY